MYIIIIYILSNHILSYNIWIKTMIRIIIRFQHVFDHSQNFDARQHLGRRNVSKKHLGQNSWRPTDNNLPSGYVKIAMENGHL
jgi:hypothetical protein